MLKDFRIGFTQKKENVKFFIRITFRYLFSRKNSSLSLDRKCLQTFFIIYYITVWKKNSPQKNISSNQLFSNLFSKTAIFTEFLPKLREREFPKFPHCVHTKCIFFPNS